jgi:hypothetical protein
MLRVFQCESLVFVKGEAPNFCVAFDHMCVSLPSDGAPTDLRDVLGRHMLLFQQFFQRIEDDGHAPFSASSGIVE